MSSISLNRVLKNKIAGGLMFTVTSASIMLVVLIGLGLYLKSVPIFESNNIWQLISNSVWKPGNGDFGFLPFIAGTLWVTALSIILALPVALLTALFLTEHSRSYIKKMVFPVLDILAGLPSVIYGVWGILIIVPFISEKLAPHFVEYSTGYTTLASGIVLSIMILPLLISLFIEIFSAVPKELREASLSLGATKWQTSKYIILRKTKPGIYAAVILAVSRAFGETIAVLMVAGNIPEIPHSLFDACYPLPALIANNYGEMLSIPLYESALMLAAFLLFIVVVFFNTSSRMILYQIEKNSNKPNELSCKYIKMERRFLEEKMAKVLMIAATSLVFIIVTDILFTILHKGLPALNWEMITKTPEGGYYSGGGGGVLNAIIGSLYIVLGSAFLGLLVSIPVVFYLNVYLSKKSKFAYIARLAFDVMFGIPSIVYGAFAFTIMIYLGMRTSLAGGILVITLLIIPIFIRSMDEVAKQLPEDLLDATYALGATKLETIKVVLEQIAPGIATATLLSIGRAIGDAAGVMFTAGFTDSIPTSLSQPAATLPLSVFFQLSSPSAEVQDRAYAAALILTIIVLFISTLGRLTTNRFSKHKI